MGEVEQTNKYYMNVVYILISKKDQAKYYIGITQNIKKRLKQHNTRGYDCYSNKYVPWKLETYIVFSTRTLAEKFEKYLKAGSGHAFLKKRLI